MLVSRTLYNCSQQDLYSAFGVAWSNYSGNQAGLLALKGKYTVAYGTDAVTAVAAAKALPPEEIRNAIPENVRTQLLSLGDTCLANQRKLKTYIEEVYKGETGKTMLVAAGFNNYTAAYNESWSDMNSMIAGGNQFIADHTAFLESGTTNMPVAFIATYTTGKTAFETAYANFLITEQATPGGTNTKINANNACYTTAIDMLNDGRIAFENDANKRALFSWAAILKYVSGIGTTGMRITPKDSVSKLNITNFNVSVQPSEQTINSEGQSTVKLFMSAALYTVVIVAPGYPTTTLQNVKLTTGSIRRLNLMLVKSVII